MVSTFCYPCAAEQLYAEKNAAAYEERRTQKRMAAMFEQGRMSPAMMSPGMAMGMGNANNVGQTSVVNVSLSPTPQQAGPASPVPQAAYPQAAYPEAQAIQSVPVPMASCPPKDVGVIAPAPAKAAY